MTRKSDSSPSTSRTASDDTADEAADEAADASSAPASPDASLAVATEAARQTLDAQHDALTGVDARAVKLLQFTVALLGVAVSGISLLDVGLGSVAPSLVVGLALLVAGAVVAVVTTAVTPRIVGVDPDGLPDRAIQTAEAPFRRALLEGYADWIHFNSYVNRRGATFVSATILLVLGGTLGVLLGFLRHLAGPFPTVLYGGAAVALVVAGYATRFHRQVWRLWTTDRPSAGPTTRSRSRTGEEGPRLDGQEVFVGETADDVVADSDGGTESR